MHKSDKLGRVWLLPLAFFAVALFAPGMSAQSLPACAAATLSTFDSEGYQCTIGNYVLEDFTLAEYGSEDQNLLPGSEIWVTPTLTSGGVSVAFSPTDGNSFAITFGEAEYQMQYELDPLLPAIQGTEIDLGPNDPVMLTGQFCGNGTFSGGYVAGQPTSCTGSNPSGIYPSTLTTTGNDTSASALFPALVTDLDTRLILDLSVGDNGAPVNVDYFGSTAQFTTASTPEPSTALLMPILLGFAWIGKKKFAKPE